MNNIIRRTWRQGSLVNIEDLRGVTFQDEGDAHTFVISGIDGDGNPVTLSGTPSGTMLRPDNTDQTLTCSVSGGKVYATLPDECYDVPGRAGITIFLTSDSQTVAIYAAVVSVTRTQSGTAAPGTTADVVDLVNAINAAIAGIPATDTAIKAAMAPTYSNSSLYAVGSYAWYNGTLYRCTTAITTAETWTSGHWTAAALGNDLRDLKSALTNTVEALSEATSYAVVEDSNAYTEHGMTFSGANGRLSVYGTAQSGVRYYNGLNGNSVLLAGAQTPEKVLAPGNYVIHLRIISGTFSSVNPLNVQITTGKINNATLELTDGDIFTVTENSAAVIQIMGTSQFGTSENPTVIDFKIDAITAEDDTARQSINSVNTAVNNRIDEIHESSYLKVLPCVVRDGYAYNATAETETSGSYRYIKYEISGNENGFFASGRCFGSKWPLVAYLDSSSHVIGREHTQSGYYNVVKCTPVEGTKYIIVNGINGKSTTNDPTQAILFSVEGGAYAIDIDKLYNYTSDVVKPLGRVIPSGAVNTDTLETISGSQYRSINYILHGEKYLSISGWTFGESCTAWVFINSSGEKVSAQTFTQIGATINERVQVPSGAAQVYVNGYTKQSPPVLLEDEGKQKYIFIGDSYSHLTNNWVNPCIEALNLGFGEYVTAVVAGSGFANQNGEAQTHTSQNAYDANVPGNVRFIDQLMLAAELVSDPLSVRHLVVCGGYNDSKASYFEAASPQYMGSTVLEQYMAYFIRTAASLFPRAKIHVGMVAYSVPGSSGDRNSLIFGSTLPVYNLCVNYGAQYLSDINILSSADLGPDGIHPNATGAKKLGRAIANSVKGGGVLNKDLLHVNNDLVIGNTHLTEETLQRLIELLS